MRSEAWGIFWGGLLCGVMDMTAALVVYGQFGLRPERLLQGIAAGVLGPHGNGIFRGEPVDEISGGTCGGGRRFVRRGCVLLYAAGGAATVEGNEKAVFVGNHVDWVAIHMVCVGLPIALSVRRFVREEEGRSVPEEDSAAELARGIGTRGNCGELAEGKGLNRQRLEERMAGEERKGSCSVIREGYGARARIRERQV